MNFIYFRKLWISTNTNTTSSWNIAPYQVKIVKRAQMVYANLFLLLGHGGGPDSAALFRRTLFDDVKIDWLRLLRREQKMQNASKSKYK